MALKNPNFGLEIQSVNFMKINNGDLLINTFAFSNNL
ncbi:hypothetical protein N824_12110 [Pedobacter sp. V48]|nr:hypothetical protein N824_12110 [Pedobacter sp. V48]